MKQNAIFAVLIVLLAAGFAVQIHGVSADADNSVYTVNTAADAPDANPGDGLCQTAANKCSLRAAIQEANTNVLLTTINLGAKTYKLTLAGAGEDAAATGDLDIASEIVILGTSQAVTIIDAKKLDRAFEVHSGGTLALFDLTITNGLATAAQGGAIAAEHADAALTLQFVTVKNSYSDGAGGAVSVVFADADISNSTFTGNSAPQGGALYFYQAGGIFPEIAFSGNTALYGGAVAVLESEVGFTDGAFTGNSAACLTGSVGCTPEEAWGGALYVQNGIAELHDLAIDSNSSTGYGGGIALYESQFEMEGISVADNTAVLSGGGLHAYDSDGMIANSAIVNNSATGDISFGGGLSLDFSLFGVLNTTISGNSAGASGGGVFINDTSAPRDVGSSTFDYVTIAGNSSGSGGGIYVNSNAAELEGSIVSGNTASIVSPDCSGTITAVQSLIENVTACTILVNTDNLTGVSAALEPLSYGIHGVTLAHVPAIGSPVLGAVATCSIDDDQFGDFREIGFPCSMGAVEARDRNLLADASFEDGSAKWKIASPDGKDKVKAKNPFSGRKSFLFAGAPGKTSTVSQKVKSPAVLGAISDGDSVCSSALFYTTKLGGTALKIQVQVKYSDGEKVKEVEPVFLFPFEYLSSCSGEILIDLTGGRTLQSAQFKVTSTSSKGKVYLDSASLTWYDDALRRDTRASGGVLPPPPAPSGFRGGN